MAQLKTKDIVPAQFEFETQIARITEEMAKTATPSGGAIALRAVVREVWPRTSAEESMRFMAAITKLVLAANAVEQTARDEHAAVMQSV